MKKLLVLVCYFIASVPVAWACSRFPAHGSYKIQEGQVYYQNDGESMPLLVKGADAATLTSSSMYAKSVAEPDKRWDLTNYASDANHVYYKEKMLEGVDPSKAILLKSILWESDGYLKDDELVYYRDTLLKGADGSSFGWMPLYQSNENSMSYARDMHHIYYDGEVLPGDPKTAFSFDYGYYLDAKHIYHRGRILEGASPDSFVQTRKPMEDRRVSVFLISNNYVFYENKRLSLDAGSFEELSQILGPSARACEGGTYAGGLLKDRDGVYIFKSTGELQQLHEVDVKTFRLLPFEYPPMWAADQRQLYRYPFRIRDFNDMVVISMSLNPQQAYEESISLDKKNVGTYYRDDRFIYRPASFPKGVEDIGEILGVDAKTFGVYASLWEVVIFKDKMNFYLKRAATYTPLQSIKITPSDAKLMCLEKDHLCLLSDNKLYYVFDDETVEQVEVDGGSLQCIKGGQLPSEGLNGYTKLGMCFDRKYFYNRGERKEMYIDGYERALSYTATQEEVEQSRLHSLKRVSIERRPFLLE